MEISRDIQLMIKRSGGLMMLVMLLVMPLVSLQAQVNAKSYTISHGDMMITLGKKLPAAELEEFIKQHDLFDLALNKLFAENFRDSLNNKGWTIALNNDEIIVLSKPLFSAENVNDIADRLMLNSAGQPAVMTSQIGYNAFRHKQPFIIKDSVVTFLLRDNGKYKNVQLAGNFTNWEKGALRMVKTDSGWIATAKLIPGKYLYKFISDGDWFTDPDNTIVENDGEGNNNSVYFFTNNFFRLNGFPKARKIILAGSFNHWNESQLRMIKTDTGWELPVFLNTGTYTYRYIVDGNWMIDPGNPDKVKNEFDDFNSVISIGRSTLFKLPGHTGVTNVFIAGSFNDWRNFEIRLKKTATGWEVPYVLGPGNYEYKFFADGNWYDATGKQIQEKSNGSVIIIEPNHTFRLKGFTAAASVYLAGDFNGWSPAAYPMQKTADGWMLDVYLSPGKHLYKFVADGQWIKDPGNTLWEENEFNTGNSIIWQTTTEH